MFGFHWMRAGIGELSVMQRPSLYVVFSQILRSARFGLCTLCCVLRSVDQMTIWQWGRSIKSGRVGQITSGM